MPTLGMLLVSPIVSQFLGLPKPFLCLLPPRLDFPQVQMSLSPSTQLTAKPEPQFATGKDFIWAGSEEMRDKVPAPARALFCVVPA